MTETQTILEFETLLAEATPNAKRNALMFANTSVRDAIDYLKSCKRYYPLFIRF